MKDLEARLASWVEAGLVTEEQARAIRAAERSQEADVVRAREGAPVRTLADRVAGPFAWHVPGLPAHTIDLDSLRAAAR